MGFTSLNHHLDLAWLHEAYRRTRRDGAPGVDGQTAADYEEHLGDNLQGRLDRAKSGTYRAPPVRRVSIPKGPVYYQHLPGLSQISSRSTCEIRPVFQGLNHLTQLSLVPGVRVNCGVNYNTP